jgi:hypothetical protein
MGPPQGGEMPKRKGRLARAEADAEARPKLSFKFKGAGRLVKPFGLGLVCRRCLSNGWRRLSVRNWM